MQRTFPLWLLSSSLLFCSLAFANDAETTPTADAVPLTSNPKGDKPKAPKAPVIPELQRIPDAKLLLTGLSKAIVPLYQELGTQSQALVKSSQAFCQDTNEESFQAVRQAWGEAMLAWQRTDALLFGPAIEEQIDFSINFYPPKKLIINGLLKSDKTLNPETLDASGVGGQGLSTLEFLLFSRDASDAEQLKRFQDEPRRCAYVQAASELLDKNIQTIVTAWTKEQFSYAEAFETAGEGSVLFVEPKEPIQMLVNKFHQSAEKLAKIRLEKPLGLGANPKNESRAHLSNAYQLDAWRSGYALKMAQASAQGLQAIFAGMTPWLEKQGHDEVKQKFDAALNELVSLDPNGKDPFALIKAEKFDDLDAYYKPALQLHRLVKNELAPAVGIQLGFNDNDGD